ncbi:hypothetical protein [Mesonia sp. K4-1]|uniref:hypothetical protein n=1 Tax=Mesonia sp. K4-1 TaxID=2602760 RepID=UPI0011CBF464|nr:hypothetical protein [Mesonia sp. K4-1]TXK78904.1 hypothetical protein FT986_03650 [Mesonia sp. K4-1]
MQKIKKIPSYTLSELIVVIIITSIVVGLAFSILRLVQNQIFSIRQNFENTTEVRKLEQSLTLDFNRYKTINYDPLKDILYFSTPINSTNYQFEDDFVVKELDTFRVSINRKIFYKMGETVTDGKIDGTKLFCSKRYQSRELFIFKQNAAIDYIEE